MAVKQTIAIIGATDHEGAVLAKGLAKGPYRLILFAHDREKLAELGKQIHELNPLAEFESVDCAMNAGWEADTIIAAVANQDKKEVAQKIKPVATQKIVLDVIPAGNPMPGNLLTGELRRFLPDSKVVEVLINDNAAHADPLVNIFLAEHDHETLQAVQKLLTLAGFHPVIHSYSPVTEL
jgi:hypothetical protein